MCATRPGTARRAEPELPYGVDSAVVLAGYATMPGKWHPVWQDALCLLATSEDRSGSRTKGRGPSRKNAAGCSISVGDVRHELASLLLSTARCTASSPLWTIGLVHYLVLAHHGKLRVQYAGRTTPTTRRCWGSRRAETTSVPPLLGEPAGKLIVDLDQFSLGGERSFTRTVLALRDAYGPFVLAYLETLVRIADWRASGRKGLAS